jgi:hypothetical protein
MSDAFGRTRPVNNSVLGAYVWMNKRRNCRVNHAIRFALLEAVATPLYHLYVQISTTLTPFAKPPRTSKLLADFIYTNIQA